MNAARSTTRRLTKPMEWAREFDIETALDSAGELFWRKGYEGTSLSDLTQAVGITPPSLRFAFESKEVLFKHVVDRYQSGHFALLADAEDAVCCCGAREVPSVSMAKVTSPSSTRRSGLVFARIFKPCTTQTK